MPNWRRLRQAAARKAHAIAEEFRNGRQQFVEMVTSTTEVVEDIVDETLHPDIDELDEDQQAVADAILNHGIENWVKISVITGHGEQRNGLAFIRLNRTASRSFAPFGVLESCAVELVAEYEELVSLNYLRDEIAGQVDKYIQIRYRDLLHYFKENKNQNRLYLMGRVPTPLKESSAAEALEQGTFEISAAVFPSNNRKWWKDVITSNVATEDFGGRNVIHRHQVMVNENMAFAGQASSSNVGPFHESPIYEEPTHTF